MSIDVAIVLGFLATTLIFGLVKGSGVKTIREFAVADRNFSTSTLTATVVATWVSGGFLVLTISQVYQTGMWFAIAGIGEIFALLIIGLILGPKIQRFFGKLSVAETMGTLFGQHARLITAIASVIYSTGWVAVQVKVLGDLCSYFFEIDGVYATIISSLTVVIYTAFGGVRSVTFTDVIQFLMFGVFIPLFAIFVWKEFGNADSFLALFRENPSYDLSQLYNFGNISLLPAIFLFLYFCVPDLSGPIFQRLLMSKNVNQVKISFSIAAIVATGIHLVLCFIAIVVYSNNQGFEVQTVAMTIINDYFSPVTKGICIAGLIALIMSTADSHLNAGSVIFAHDICKPLGIKTKNELVVSRIFSLVAGTGAVFFALTSPTLLELAQFASNFYMPVVTVPLFVSILGFRSTFRVFVISIVAGILTVIYWRMYLMVPTGIDSVIPGLIANFIAFMGAHYLLGEPGGFGGNLEPNDNEFTEEASHLEKKKRSLLSSLTHEIDELKRLGFVAYSNKFLPEKPRTYFYFSGTVILTMIVTVSIDREIYTEHTAIINVVQALVLAIATSFFLHGSWPEYTKRYMGIFWCSAIFISLACISSFLVILTNFSHLSLLILTIHLCMIPLLLGWRLSLLMIVTGLTTAFILYSSFVGEMEPGQIADVKLKLFYLFLFIVGFILTIIKTKQDDMEETASKVETLGSEVSKLSEKVEHYSERISDQQQEIERLGATAQKILNNLNHELRLPVGNVMNFSEMLSEMLKKTDDKYLQDLSDEVFQNSNRLSTMILNMLDLATLDVKKVDLQKSNVDFSQLVQERVERCKKVYLQSKSLEFVLDIEPEIMVGIDVNYIRQTVDNLVINAISFSDEGKVRIAVKKGTGHVSFEIKDEGKGIPTEELYDIFTPFKMGSNTESKAEGRGVGLSLCKSAVEAHGGSIIAESKGKGALFRFVLPL